MRTAQSPPKPAPASLLHQLGNHLRAIRHPRIPAVPPLSPYRLTIAVALAASLLWVYWPTLDGLAHRWSQEPQYSHGYLVPVFALVLLWHRRQQLAPGAARGHAWGLALLAAGVVLRLAGAYVYLDWLEGLSLVPCLGGIAVLLGGWQALSWSWPAIAFLVFMVPLPFRVEVALAGPLQRLATAASTFSLQSLGLPATSEGNIISLGDNRIGVVEACGGLSMLLSFVALAVAVAAVIQRPWVDKLVILASAIPIALFANVVRITATGILFELAGSRLAQAFFHDVAGWFMIVLASLILWGELDLLSRVLPEPPKE